MKFYNANTGYEEPIDDGWSQVMIMVLRENWETMSDEELSNVIGLSPRKVRKKMYLLGIKRPTVKKELKARLTIDGEPKPLTQKQIDRQIKERKLEEERKRKNAHHALSMASKMRQDRKVLKTRSQDFSQMRTLRIDSKTWIYIKPGDDVEKLKQQYSRTLSKDGFSKIEY